MKGKAIIFHGIIFTYFAVVLVLILAMSYYWSAYQKTPEQPIAFPHPTHADQIGLPCSFCHEYVDISSRAGIPPVQTCMNCHQKVARDKSEVQKLLRYWKDKEPIPWIRIHSLPEHVFFSHKRHVRKGIECEQCHGSVKIMNTIRKLRPLNMGWCVSCHRAYAAPLDCLICHK